MSDPMDPILRALRAERETSPWWLSGPSVDDRRDPDAAPYLPTPGSIWDDSETNTARRRALLDAAAARMDMREDAI